MGFNTNGLQLKCGVNSLRLNPIAGEYIRNMETNYLVVFYVSILPFLGGNVLRGFNHLRYDVENEIIESCHL